MSIYFLTHLYLAKDTCNIHIEAEKGVSKKRIR